MNGNQLSIENLNAQRRQAVRLRLQGEKLAVVTACTGLSAPTVIAAVKAFRQGGWNAVEVSPRKGRPPKAEGAADAEHVRALVQAMLAGPPDRQGLPHSLWSRKAVGEWLATQAGARRSAGAVARLCQALQLDFDEQSIPSPRPGIGGVPARHHGAESYLPAWPGVPADSGKIGLLCVKAARGQLLWLAFSGPPEARHCLDLLSRLEPRHGRLELSIRGAARLLRVPSCASGWTRTRLCICWTRSWVRPAQSLPTFPKWAPPWPAPKGLPCP